MIENERYEIVKTNDKYGVIDMKNKFDILLDFWNWLGEQGLAYKSLYRGDPEYVEDLIRTYLKGKKWVCRKEYD